MGENSNIEWTDHTFNPWVGCARVSPGCTNCYAEHNTYFVNIQRSQGHELWGKDAERRIASPAMWKKPHTWNRMAIQANKRARVFCASLADVFEDRPDLVEPRDRLLDLIDTTPHLDWLLLTKRPQNVMRLVQRSANHSNFVRGAALAARWEKGRPPANVWMGVTGEDRKRLGDRVEALYQIPAVVRFVSAEPLLEDVGDTLEAVLGVDLRGDAWVRMFPSMVDWVIFGGESGANARECDVEWIRRGVDICRGAHVAPFVKQLGRRSFDADFVGDAGIKDKKGGDITEFPPDLRVREFPIPRRAA